MRLKKVSRLDSMPLTAAYFTPEGYLRDKPVVTTCGIFEYQNDDGTIHRELRLPEDVFSPESLKTYKGKPIIFTHEAGEINKDNVHQETIGTILSDGIRDGENVRADIVIHDSDQLKRGLRELSLGYDCDLEEKPGKWNGQPYDAIQHNIRINHLALVEEARAGHNARLNLDGKNQKGGTKKMRKKRVDGVAETLTPEQLEAAVAMYLAANGAGSGAGTQDDEGEEQADPVEQVRQNADRRDEDIASVGAEEIPGMQEDIKTLLAEIDRLNGANDMNADEDDDPDKADESDDPDKTDEDDGPDKADGEGDPDKSDGDDAQDPKVDTTVKMDSVERNWAEMYSICQMATKLGLDNFVPRSVMDGKKRIISTVNPKLKLDGKSRSYIDGAYAVAVQTALGRKSAVDKARKMVGGGNARRADSAQGVSSAEAARQRMIGRMQNKGKESK